VLNRDGNQYGKQHLLDSSEETCWNSDSGSPQFILFSFPQPVILSQLEIMFQGGFVGQVK